MNNLTDCPKHLDGTWVKHHASRGCDGAWRQVADELGADNAGGAVGAHDLAPDGAHERSVLLGLGTVHVENLLSAVCGGGGGVLNSLDLDEVGVGRLSTEGTAKEQVRRLQSCVDRMLFERCDTQSCSATHAAAAEL